MATGVPPRGVPLPPQGQPPVGGGSPEQHSQSVPVPNCTSVLVGSAHALPAPDLYRTFSPTDVAFWELAKSGANDTSKEKSSSSSGWNFAFWR